MKEKFIRFMQGRYGVVDSYGKFLFVVGFILTIFISPFVHATILRAGIYTIGWVVLIYTYARFFSRNIQKRYQENIKFLNKTEKIRKYFLQQRRLLEQRKVYHIYKCPTCKQKIRIPRGKGKIEVRCPKCGTTFIKKS
ncbi:MAG: zinc-ribbon domain-containing protein [Candidatus Ruminococcus intestinipullorum]|nr:zinc-ribbon domain-containing protein [Candidatus Ruminococcus intestinipullorum]